MTVMTSGPRRVPADHAGDDANVGSTERWVSIAAGSALVVRGIARRDAGGALLALLGAVLVHRGATAHCPLYAALGVDTAHPEDTGPALVRMHAEGAVLQASDAARVERSVTIARPAAELYAFWKQPANLPRIFEFLESVTTLDATHARWRATPIAGVPIEWTAEVIVDVPDERIAWKSGDSRIPNAGSVSFRPAPGDRGTEVRLVLEWLPPAGRAGQLAARLVGRDPDRHVREGLRRFKQLVETGTVPTTDGQPAAR